MNLPIKFIDRQNALANVEAAARAKRDAAIAAAQRALTKAHDDHATAVECARRESEAYHRSLDQDLATKVLAALVPHAESFGASPRSSAVKISEVWKAYNCLAIEHLGSELEWPLLAFAFAGDDFDLLADDSAWTFAFANPFATAVERAARSFALAQVAPSIAENLVRSLESAVHERIATARHRDPERARARMSAATRAGQMAAVRAVDAARDAKVNREQRGVPSTSGAPVVPFTAPVEEYTLADVPKRDRLAIEVALHRRDEGGLDV